MEERGNKTIICSVFFLDIVEYSKKSVSGQISLKERFNSFLSTAIQGVPINDRIILDTGDGAAISFLGDVEDALRAALSMRASLLAEDGLVDPPLLVRMGVNLGPVRLVRDINGQPNIVGDGINVAQRVMGFAEPGQILVSRSYYDAASRLSQEYAGMFHYVGSRTDKHVREHEVYAIGYPGDMTSSHKTGHSKLGGKFAEYGNALASKGGQYWDALLKRYDESVSYVRTTFDNASNKQRAVYIGLASVAALLLLLLVVKLASKPKESQVPLPKITDTKAAINAHSGVVAATSAPVVATKPATQGIKQVPHPSAKDQAEKKDKTAKQDKKPAHGGESSGTASAVVSLTVKPWGEVYLDDKMAGVSPPLTRLKVTAGEHVIEIKNANFPVFKKSVKLKAGENISIRHTFAN